MSTSHDTKGFGPDLNTFDWKDPFRLEDQLTEDERMLRPMLTRRPNFSPVSPRPTAKKSLHPRFLKAWATQVCLA